MLAISETPTRGSFTYQLDFPMLGPPDAIASTAIYASCGWVIYGPSISSGGRGVERAGHLVLNALHGAGAEAAFSGNLKNALAWPGGNITGVNFFVTAMESKRLGLLRALIPGVQLIAVLLNSNRPDHAYQLREVLALSDVRF